MKTKTLPLLNRDKDQHLLNLSIKAYILLVTAISAYAIPRFQLYILPVHLGIYLFFVGRFITMYHDINHYPLFRNRHLNMVYVDVMAILYGFTPFTYFSHHVVMHHPEDNGFDDFSTTLTYKRDSIRSFLSYYFTFFFSLLGVRNYLKNHRNAKARRYARKVVIGEISYLVLIIIGLWMAPVWTLVVLVIPIVVTRSLLIVGNWGEHAFIDPKDPANLYRNSTNILGKYNKTHFNVGYHIGHHLNPIMHYLEMPADFERNIEKYGKEDAIVFRDLHYPHIWLFLMKRNYRRLADYFIQLPNAPERSTEEIIELLRSRTAVITEAPGK